MQITIPHNYSPRPYQIPILKEMDKGKKRIVWVAHRRSGKDKTCVNIVAKEMLKRPGTYYYIFPTYNQGRKILWDGMDRDGNKFLSHFPPALIEGKPNETEMKIKFKNGALFQIIGSDNIDSIVGTNPVGVVFSEYSLIDPTVWGFVRPILAENGGWAIFVFTPRGENHAYDIYELAKNDPSWYCQLNPAEQTKAIAGEILEQERMEIIKLYGDDSLYRQEYDCNFTVPIAGSYYANAISSLYKNGQIGNVPYDPRFVVDTYWDLGINDKMAIWFTQSIGPEMRVIDYEEGSNQGLPHYIGKIRERKYIYGRHVAPHDIEVRELTTGISRRDTAKTLGIDFSVAPQFPLMDGIDAVRNMLPRCWIDAKKCKEGLNALKNYRKIYDEKRKTYQNTPYHDWSSNAADAFRMIAVSIQTKKSFTPPDEPSRKLYG